MRTNLKKNNTKTISESFDSKVKDLEKLHKTMKEKDARKHLLDSLLPTLQSVKKELDLGHSVAEVLHDRVIGLEKDVDFYKFAAEELRKQEQKFTKVRLGPLVIGLIKN